MKFTILTILILTFASLTFAQNEVKLDWEEFTINSKGKTVLQFSDATIENKLPYYNKDFKGEFISSVSLDNMEFETLSDPEIKSLPKNFSPSNIEPKVTHGKSKGQWISSVQLVPLRKWNGEWQKLVSFKIKKHTSAARTTKTTAYNWKSTSVLKSGAFYKIGITKSGIHKIDYSYILENLNVDPTSLNPANIKLYGNGGAMLPQKNSETWYDDLDENAIYIQGGSDGEFNSSDYILFYAQGPIEWKLSSDSSGFEHSLNRYSDTAYYFLNLTSSGTGKRVSTAANISGATKTFTSYDAYDAYESDDENIVHSGRNWYGFKFDFDLTKSYSFNTQGIQPPGLTVTTRLGGLSQAQGGTSFQVLANSNNLGTVSIPRYNDPNYPTLKTKTTTWDSISTSGTNQSITISYSKGSSSASIGYTDFIRLNYRRKLELYGSETTFRSIESLDHPVSEFSIGNTSSNVQIWDITDITNIQSINYSQNGSTSTFSTETDTLKEFIVFTGSNFSEPNYFGVLANQNLHELETPNLLIITHSKFRSEAQRLAEHRSNLDGLKVEVVNVSQVYNEFSSGQKDPSAIRNMCKMFYDREPSKFKYLLLMGDCSYDYKNRVGGTDDYVPVYESRNSENPISSHSSDDYYALLDDEEGYWCASCPDGDVNDIKEYLDIGVGRIPAVTTEHAKAVVDKIIHYDAQKENIEECHDVSTYNSGKWKNEIVVIADDSDFNSHLKSAEKIYTMMQNYPDYHVDKIYIDAYEQISGAGGQTAPTVKTEINRKMERGALIFNYSGHGGELGLSHEGVISVDQILNWKNIDNLPLMFTATCEFGRYDDPERISAGEHTVLNANGGVVGIVTTTRPVYGSENDLINNAFFSNVFEPIGTNDYQMPRLGDVMRNAKNEAISKSNSVNNRNFALLGDPSMTLAYPQHNVVLTSINNNILTDTTADTINALQKVTMEGLIQDVDSNIISTFNGVLEVSIYDKLSIYRTLGDENGSPRDFEERNTKIFEGLASVENGKFSFSFIVPKDIKYTFGNGKANFYAASHNLESDANGSNLSFIVGGTNANAAEDNTPPDISLFMDDESFVFGGTTSQNPVLLAKLFDEYGINTTGVGVGHEISSILDEKSDDVIVLNEYYTSELNDYQRGVVKYPFENLVPGNHKISLKAWDTYNNSNEEYLEFVVVNDADIALDHILNYPNPFTTNTSFHFDHNRVCDDIQVMVQIYTVSGKLIKTLQQYFPQAPAHISGIDWDGRDDFGKNIGRGVYVYKVKVRSLTDNAQVQEFQKLVILK